MNQLKQTENPKFCLTASGCLIHQHKVMLIKHKKVKFWLCPGGHIEDNELPHQAAEREFWEETGIKVKAKPFGLMESLGDTQQLPSPFSTNLHWVCRENFERRIKDPRHYQLVSEWSKGCEKHLNFMYLVEAVGSLDFKENVEETDGIAWFREDELDELETLSAIREEVKNAFKVVKGF